MTSENGLLPMLRRLDEIERKLDRMMEELRTLNTPAAIGYSARGATFQGRTARRKPGSDEQIFGVTEQTLGRRGSATDLVKFKGLIRRRFN